MGKLFSDKPIFVDLFYGVVIGSAIALLSLTDTQKLIYQIIWVVAVLEDWYLYYRFVADDKNKKVTYSFRSLLQEFAILVSWFLGFQALKEDHQLSWFPVFFSVFYILKVLSGVTFYLKHKQFFTRRMVYDSFWLILPLSACYLWRCGTGWEFSNQFWLLTGITVVVLIAWWLCSCLAPYKQGDGS